MRQQYPLLAQSGGITPVWEADTFNTALLSILLLLIFRPEPPLICHLCNPQRKRVLEEPIRFTQRQLMALMGDLLCT